MSKLAALLKAWGPGGIFVLALLDSAGIPLPAAVDVLMLLVGVTNPSQVVITALLATAGSVVGCMVLFQIARAGGEAYLNRFTVSPRAAKFREWFGRYGLAGVFAVILIPIPGMPTKIFVVSAGASGTGPRSFAGVVLVGRLLRYFGLAWLGLHLGTDARPWLMAHVWHMVVAAVVLIGLLGLGMKAMERSAGRA